MCLSVLLAFGVLNTSGKRKVWRQACHDSVMFDAVPIVNIFLLTCLLVEFY